MEAGVVADLDGCDAEVVLEALTQEGGPAFLGAGEAVNEEGYFAGRVGEGGFEVFAKWMYRGANTSLSWPIAPAGQLASEM